MSLLQLVRDRSPRMRRFGESLTKLGLVVAAVLCGLGLAAIIITLIGGSPIDAAAALFSGAFGSWQRVGVTAARMVPLIAVALGWIVAFRAAKVNLGLQGQLIVGGIVAVWVAIEGPDLPPPLALALATFSGIAAAALYAAIAALLWAKRGVNEIVSTLMLTFIAQQVFAWLIRGPLRDTSSSSDQTKPLQAAYRWPLLIKGSPFSLEVGLIIVAVVLLVFVLNRTGFGFKLRLTGENPEAARHAGINTLRTVVMSFVISGGLAGLAGAGLVLGGERSVVSGGFGGNIGFTGVVVALVAMNSPISCIPAAALFAALDTGGSVMQARADIPSEVILITQGVIVILVAASTLLIRRFEARATDARIEAERTLEKLPVLVDG